MATQSNQSEIAPYEAINSIPLLRVRKPYNARQWRLLSKQDIILYAPNSVSRRKRIISA